MSEPKIRIARVGNALWRIYSLSDPTDPGAWVDCDAQAMSELLDELLKRVREFHPTASLMASEQALKQAEKEAEKSRKVAPDAG